MTAGPAAHPLLASAYDLVTAPLERRVLAPARARLLAGATGRVLEVGAGTGANLAWYPATVDALDLCEPDPHMRRRLSRRVASQDWPFTVTVHDVAATGPFPAPAYDLVVSTLVLCTVADPQAVAAALRAVLTEGGRVAYIEHVGVGGVVGRLQTLASPLWGRVAGGCRLDRPATAALRGAGLVPIEQRWLRLPPPLLLAVSGQAIIRRRPAGATLPDPAPSPATVPV